MHSVVGSQPPHCVSPFPCLSKEQNPTQQCPRQKDRLKISVRGTRAFHSFGSMRTQCGKNLFKVFEPCTLLLCCCWYRSHCGRLGKPQPVGQTQPHHVSSRLPQQSCVLGLGTMWFTQMKMFTACSFMGREREIADL